MKSALLYAMLLASFCGASYSDEYSLGDLDKNIARLYGTPEMATYIRLSSGIVPIPNTYVFDAKTIYAGASFTNGSGRIVVGLYKDLSEDALKHVEKTMIEKREQCGLKISRFGKGEGAEVVQVSNGTEYMWFAVQDPSLWKTSVELYCRIKHQKR